MERRRVLKSGVVVAIGAIPLSGCVSETENDDSNTSTSGSQPGSESESESDPESESGSESESETAEDAADNDSSTDETDSETETSGPLSIDEATLEEQPHCIEPTVSFDGGTETVTVTGCVRGSNGCHEPALSHAALGEATLELTVESVDTSTADEMCTSVVVENGYKVIINMAGGLPDQVAVTHDDMDGVETVRRSK